MRLSEAIMLGSATCMRIAGDINSCAFGGALNAMGVPRAMHMSMEPVPGYPGSYALAAACLPSVRERYRVATELWPWISGDSAGMDQMNYLGEAIYTRFDNQVCTGEITLEELADYVRSIEPDCNCNRFNCNCKESETGVSHDHSTNSETAANVR